MNFFSFRFPPFQDDSLLPHGIPRVRRLLVVGFLALVGGLCGFGCDSGTEEPSSEVLKAPQPELAPPTPPGNVSIAGLREELDIGEAGQFQRTGDEITNINLSGTDVADLSPLEGLPLATLSISECPVDDLSPLAGMPLKGLSAQDTQVTNLTPLADTQLVELYLRNSPVADISPLAKLPITQLNLVGTKVTDLGAVRDMPLNTLWIGSTSVPELSALRGKSLVSLDIEDTTISDLSPLADMKSLQRLNIAKTEATDLTPLAGLRLTRLIFDPSKITQGLEIARQMTTLQEIGLTFDGMMPPAEFWSQYDAGTLAE